VASTESGRPLALITGASSGIGATFARHLAARGCDLVLVARRKDRLEQQAREIESSHAVRAEILPADLTHKPELKMVEDRIAGAPNLEYLVNNAGFGIVGRFFSLPVEGQDQMHRLHVLATLRLTHAALQGMVVRRRGAVINVSSVAGFFTTPGNVSYCATKHWMNVFTEGLSLELKSIGSPVTVQALCPGFTYSEFHDVMGVSRGKRAPRFFWMSAERVAASSLADLRRGRLYVVPGWQYRILTAIATKLPGRFRVALEAARPR